MELVRTHEFAVRMTTDPGTPVSTASYRQAKNGKQIAVLGVRGPMLKPQSWFGVSTVQLRNDLRMAAANPEVSGILLDIWSPGGSVAGMDALIADVNTARRRKPVWSQIDDLGASAAYELASQSDAIFATGPATAVGSIGTMMAVYDMSGLAEREGVKALMFKTGPLKGAGWPGTIVTDEQQADFQQWVDGSQLIFDASVRKGRGLSSAELEGVRTGGLFLAPRAMEMKLIDGIQSFDKTLADLASAA
jgi:signal peptide peptidase SppA